MRTLRYITAAAFGLSGAALAWRAIHGPFHIGSLPVHSPLNAQSVFGVSIVALLSLNARPANPGAKTRLRYPVFWLLAILLLTVATVWQAVGFPLVFDDYTLVRQAQNMSIAYNFTHGGGDGFFRPLGYFSLHLDALWAARDPVKWHLTGLALHLLNIVLIWILAAHFLADRSAALWAAALFALHGTVLLTPMYLAARFDVLSAFLVLAGLVLFLRYLDRSQPLLLVAAFACMLVALLSKEVAFCFPVLATLLAGRRAWAYRRTLVAFFGLAAVVFVYRWMLVGGVGGYHDPATGAPQVLHATWLGYLKGFGLRIWSAFFFPVNWSRKPGPWFVVCLLAYIGTLAWLAIRSRSDRRRLTLLLAFTTIPLLPIAHLLLVDASLLGAGRFYLALPGFAMMMALAMQTAGKLARPLAVTSLILFQFAALRHNLTIWSDIAALADRTCAQSAAILRQASEVPDVSGLPREINGVPFLANGFDECVAFHSGRAQEQFASKRVEYRWDPHTQGIIPK